MSCWADVLVHGGTGWASRSSRRDGQGLVHLLLYGPEETRAAARRVAAHPTGDWSSDVSGGTP